MPSSNIKPDNILLDGEGHAALTDFNIAMHYSRSRLHTSVTGSMAYMALKVVDTQRRGYSWQVDWWSLGVCAFELLWNKRPFDGKLTQWTICGTALLITTSRSPHIVTG